MKLLEKVPPTLADLHKLTQDWAYAKAQVNDAVREVERAKKLLAEFEQNLEIALNKEHALACKVHDLLPDMPPKPSK